MISDPNDLLVSLNVFLFFAIVAVLASTYLSK